MTTVKVIGKPTGRVEGPLKVSGSARYAADIIIPGTLWVKVLRSQLPHAIIKSVDISKALTVPGVHTVLTGKDIQGPRIGRRVRDMPVLAGEKVRFIGEKVAAVAADTEEAADEAVGLIEVDYEELAAVFDPIEAMNEGSPILHTNINSYKGLPEPVKEPTNVFIVKTWRTGNIEQGFKEADRIFEDTFTTVWAHHAYMEPHACLVEANTDKVQIWGCNKTPYDLRWQVAEAAGINANQVVVHPTAIGGDFGGKGSFMDAPLCYFLSKKSGRPVKMVMDYTEEFMAGNPRHPGIIYIKTGVKNDGTLIARHARIFFNSGAYGAFKPVGWLLGAEAVQGPYRTPNTLVESYFVYTNNVPCGHMRAPGDPQAVFAGESQIDIIARAMNIDPVEFRLKNILRNGDESPTGQKYTNLKALETLSRAVEISRYYKPKKRGTGRGVAFACWPSIGGESNVTVGIEPDGSITAKTSITDVGGGTHTIIQQIISEELSVPIETVRVLQLDTDWAENDTGCGGSRATRTGGLAALSAVNNLKDNLRKIAAELYGWTQERVKFQNGKLINQQDGSSISLGGIAQRSASGIVGYGHYNSMEMPNVVGVCAQVAEVEIDQETGQVRLKHITSACDAGRVINPLGFEGQIDGGVMMGIGYALMEQLLVENGRVTTTTFGEYKINTAADIPDLKKVIVESPDGIGPYGAKSIGELPTVPVAAAIANAVEDAVGVRIKDLPITAEKVYAALMEKHAEASVKGSAIAGSL